MADPVTLKRIEETAAALQVCGVVTLEDLRISIGQDVDQGIRWVSSYTGISDALLMALLIAEARDDAGKKGTRRLLRFWRSLKSFPAVWEMSRTEIHELWRNRRFAGLWEGRKPAWAVIRQLALRPKRIWHNRRRHWLDVLAVSVVLIVATGLVWRVWSTIKQSKAPVEYVAVKQDVALPVFHKISDDVVLKKEPGSKGTFRNLDQVRGRYTLAAIPAGTILQTDQLLNDELSKKMPGRKLLSVPLKPGAYIAALSAPSEATMVLSPRTLDEKRAAPPPFDVILLSIEGTGDAKSATVALPEDKFNIAAPLLGSHDVFLVQSMR